MTTSPDYELLNFLASFWENKTEILAAAELEQSHNASTTATTTAGWFYWSTHRPNHTGNKNLSSHVNVTSSTWRNLSAIDGGEEGTGCSCSQMFFAPVDHYSIPLLILCAIFTIVSLIYLLLGE